MRTACVRFVLILTCAFVYEISSAATLEPCVTPDHHAFDFWLGDWIVKTPDGKLAGSNHITHEHSNCVIHEHYTTDHGYSGESLNIYDATRKVWHQTWVDSDGMLLVLEGGIHDHKMILEGQTINPPSKSAKQRITWTPNADGSVRQLWEAMDAKGKWTMVFDGIYKHT